MVVADVAVDFSMKLLGIVIQLLKDVFLCTNKAHKVF